MTGRRSKSAWSSIRGSVLGGEVGEDVGDLCVESREHAGRNPAVADDLGRAEARALAEEQCDLAALRVDDPIFVDAVPGIDLRLFDAIARDARRREDLDDEIGDDPEEL